MALIPTQQQAVCRYESVSHAAASRDQPGLDCTFEPISTLHPWDIDSETDASQLSLLMSGMILDKHEESIASLFELIRSVEPDISQARLERIHAWAVNQMEAHRTAFDEISREINDHGCKDFVTNFTCIPPTQLTTETEDGPVRTNYFLIRTEWETTSPTVHTKFTFGSGTYDHFSKGYSQLAVCIDRDGRNKEDVIKSDGKAGKLTWDAEITYQEHT